MCVYSCYFSPGDPSEVFEKQILTLEESLSETVGRVLIGGGFNVKSHDWGETQLDWTGILIGEMVARNGLMVLSQGREKRFRQGAGGSIIDLTLAALRLALRRGTWCVLEMIILSDHR